MIRRISSPILCVLHLWNRSERGAQVPLSFQEIVMSNAHEKLAMWIAWKLPKEIVLWAVIRAFAHATTGKYGNTQPDSIGYKEVYDRWVEQYNG